MSNIESDLAIADQSFLEDVLAGLGKPNKTLPSKYFYDKTGSELFERICDLDEYYPTRTELAIMQESVEEMGATIGPDHVLLELGSGSSTKTRLLLEHLDHLAAYVPFDISQSALDEAVDRLSDEFPELHVHPVCGDFMEQIEIPELEVKYTGSVTYFPGSTIGNLTNSEAVALMRRIRNIDEESDLLIGIDLEKDQSILLNAYDDSEDVTAAFNLNVLDRINTELGGDFEVDQFRHQAIYNEEMHRIEMHLVSLTEQTVHVGEAEIHFSTNESICTEHSHKYTVDRFAELAQAADFQISKLWTDPKEWFAVILLTPSA